eukprot:SAG11_NODE_6078_length_1392_cov_1.283063_2_plen_86_part_00
MDHCRAGVNRAWADRADNSAEGTGGRRASSRGPQFYGSSPRPLLSGAAALLAHPALAAELAALDERRLALLRDGDRWAQGPTPFL